MFTRVCKGDEMHEWGLSKMRPSAISLRVSAASHPLQFPLLSFVRDETVESLMCRQDVGMGVFSEMQLSCNAQFLYDPCQLSAFLRIVSPSLQHPSFLRSEA